VLVLVSAPGPVLLPFGKDKNLDALVLSFLPGEQAGFAFADCLFGRSENVCSGKLPVSMPMTENDFDFTPEQFPGVIPGSENKTKPSEKVRHAHYDEGLLVGHRYYAAKGKEPMFGFGFGLGLNNVVIMNNATFREYDHDGNRNPSVKFCLFNANDKLP